MKILCFDCSAVPCSVAILESGKILGSAFINVKLTHSQTLMPLVESILSATNIDINEIEGFAISNGPGSFTGVRIGISVVKGLSIADKKPCVAVSTLYAMSQNYSDIDCVVCAVMDARCNQVYNAFFDISGGRITRFCEDRAIMCDELAEEIKNMDTNKSIILVGDGTDLFYPFVQDVKGVKKSDIKRRFQNAVGVGFAAEENFVNGSVITPDELLPMYLRLPQAERELKLKKENKK